MSVVFGQCWQADVHPVGALCPCGPRECKTLPAGKLVGGAHRIDSVCEGGVSHRNGSIAIVQSCTGLHHLLHHERRPFFIALFLGP
jgi:hypothetical protein